MSEVEDLDGLYGDLYEVPHLEPRDESQDDVPPASHKFVETAPSTQPPVSSAASALKLSTSSPAFNSPPASAAAKRPVDVKPSVPAPALTAQLLSHTQQIPTYEEKPSDLYPETSRPRMDGGFVPLSDRSVRPSEMKDEGKMFIGGLNWDTTDESLRNYFSQFGKVDACTIMRDAAGRSRCFAFLTFEDPASVNAVMVREHTLDGKIIDPKRAIPRQEHQRATKLFIGGLAGSVTSESMREFFSQFGKVIDSTVMLDRETGRSKGFGFVSFEDTNVQPFLGFGHLEIDGKLIDVKLAQPRYQRDTYQESGDDYSGNAGMGRGRGGGGGGGGGAGGYTGMQGGNFGGPGTGGAAGNTPFDPQALAALYTRMFQITGGAQMNPMMGMNPMLAGGMGMGAGMGMGMGRGMGMGMGVGMGPGVGMNPGAMGRGGGAAGGMGPMMNQNIPKGPRGAPTGPGGVGMGAGVGPQRVGQRGQHNYHPYAR